MARLPMIGGDNNSWGTVLSDYLQQTLAADGTLVTAATNPYTGSSNPNLADAGKPGLLQLAGDLTGSADNPQIASIVTAGSTGSASAIPVIGYDTKGRITSAASVAPVVATTSTQGVIQLAGDLSGTATSPSLAIIGSAGSVGGPNMIPVITYDAAGRITATTTSVVPCYALAADFTTTSKTAAATNLSFAADANSIWTIEYHMTVQCSSTGGMYFGIYAPTGSSVEGDTVGFGTSLTTNVNVNINSINALETATPICRIANTPGPVRIWVTVTVGSTAGNITLYAASRTNGQTTTIMAKSWVSAQLTTTV